MNQFDHIAKFYDPLATLVFGKSLLRSQTCFLNLLPEKGNVLILGGGTGWVAEKLLKRSGVTIFYLEASDQMLTLAKKRLASYEGRVVFIHGTQDSIPQNIKFDGLITNFILDLFSDSNLRGVVDRLKSTMSIHSLWIVTDFTDQGKLWQRVLLWVMYRFFHITTGIEAVNLPAWELILLSSGVKTKQREHFFGGFIETGIYSL